MVFHSTRHRQNRLTMQTGQLFLIAKLFQNKPNVMAYDCATSASEVKAHINKLLKQVKNGFQTRLTVKF